jgi:serine/threonine protein phosphatase PrpC
VATTCPACGTGVTAGDRYCEACGQDLAAPATATVPPEWVSSADPVTTCAGCGGTAFGPEGYCDECGQRRANARDHTELDLGSFAAVTDRGLRHHRNEDAVAVGRIADAILAIVCDGVSSSERPDAASNGAVDAAAAAMVGALQRRATPGEAITVATRAAQAAAALAAGPDPGENPPASTFVCAVVGPDAVTVGWVGDSRAYWLPDGDGEAACLTVDDSVAGHAASHGLALPAGIAPGMLVRWLGADATDTAPHLRTFTPSGPGRVLVCSDGLFKYRPDPAELAAATPRLRPLETVQALIKLALDAGGADNISAAVLPFPPVVAEE